MHRSLTPLHAALRISGRDSILKPTTESGHVHAGRQLQPGIMPPNEHRNAHMPIGLGSRVRSFGIRDLWDLSDLYLDVVKQSNRHNNEEPLLSLAPAHNTDRKHAGTTRAGEAASTFTPAARVFAVWSRCLWLTRRAPFTMLTSPEFLEASNPYCTPGFRAEYTC